MKLEPGSRLTHYQIVEMIGKGGMGEVYRANDARLPRDVAVKTSAVRFSERFAREAKVIASLNHPNICTLFDIGPDFLVMEMIEGATLAERIKDGPLRLEEAVSIMRQVADALEYAHERGVVHRDLKPGNIKIRPDGVVKVLDFGLAKVTMPTPSSASEAKTITPDATEAGVVLGTAAYMSPEQVLGKPADKRTDVWAFGVVFYEMLTGARMHQGDSSQEIIASVLKDEPDLKRVPHQVRRLLSRCLEKDPNKRLRHVGDVLALLDEGPPSVAPPVSSSQVKGRKAPWAIVAMLSVAILGLIFVWPRDDSATQGVGFEVGPAEGMTFNPGAAMTVSPDGRWMVFQANGSDGVTRFWLRSLEGPELRPLPDTERIGANAPPAFWSFDSRWVVFAALGDGAKLRKVDIQGGPPQELADWPAGLNGATWNSDGVILGGTSRTGTSILKLSARGGQPPVLMTALAVNDSSHLYPQFLPDEKHFLYMRVSSDPTRMGIYVGDVDSKPEEQSMERVLASDRQAYYAALPGSKTGHLVFMRQGALMAQPFDPTTRTLTGDPIGIAGAERVDSYAAANYAIFSVSNTGTLAYRTAGQQTLLTWYDVDGKPTGTLGDQADYSFPAISPDSNHIAVSRTGQSNRDILILDVARGTSNFFTFDPGRDDYPAWSPDGKQIAFSSDRSGQMDLYVGPANSPGQERLLLKTDERKFDTHWFRGFVLFTSLSLKTSQDVWAVPTGKEAIPIALAQAQFTERQPRVSPDGHWVAYSSEESGRSEIWVRPFNSQTSGSAVGPGRILSKGGGSRPIWRDNGLLYYISPTSDIVSVSVDTTSGLPQAGGTPRTLFKAPPLTINYGWDLSPDGKRFLFVAEPAGVRTIPFTVKLNWAAGLKK